MIVVVGHGADDVRRAVASWRLTPKPIFVEQAKQLGTGHDAGRRARDRASRRRARDGRRLRPGHRRRRAALGRVTSAQGSRRHDRLDRAGRSRGYGRVVRKRSRLVEVVEDVDASPRSGRSVRPRSCCSRSGGGCCSPRCPARPEEPPARVLPEPGDPDDARGRGEGQRRARRHRRRDGGELRAGLAAVEAVARERINAGHMANGVTLVDRGPPTSTSTSRSAPIP